MAESKTQPTKASVTAFIAAIADEQRRQDCQAVAKLMQKATGAKPVMWGDSIVGFGTYQLTYADGRTADWPIVGFSPRKNDLTVYLMPGFDQLTEPLSRLGKHKTGKVCLYLKRLADVDTAVLAELIDTSVQAMADRRTS
jgi:hypothetical protein